MYEISFDDFLKVDIRVGRILSAEPLENARRPAFVLHLDFGPEIGILKSSAQITDLYDSDDLINKLVMGVVNFPEKQIGKIKSQCLITGFHRVDGKVVLATPDSNVPLGTKLA